MSKEIVELKEKSLTIGDRSDLKKYAFKADFKDPPEKTTLDADVVAQDGRMSTYIISKDLVTAVNAAIITGRPLLITGEPGCGKTKLAKAIAVYFHEDQANKYYFEWFIKSKSIARNGCYNFDHIRRLRNATIAKSNGKLDGKIKENLDEYITLGPIGMAFTTQVNGSKPTILLIDEIDKGDIDFPNDLLLELDEMRFSIAEKDNAYISADKDHPPLVFITSNDERELPPAFLRRCLYYNIPPFESDFLEKIAKVKLKEFYTDLGITDTILDQDANIKKIIDKYQEIRRQQTNNKPPSTSELLDWLKLMANRLHDGNCTLDDLLNADEKEEGKALQRLALKLL